jgi:hypothetical protein
LQNFNALKTMIEPIRILLQTTILATEDDWSIARFSLLKNYLASLVNAQGELLCEVTARDRLNDAAGNDPILISIDQSNFDQLWLFAVDVGDGITDVECKAINKFRQRGGGLLVTRDHQDLGCSLCQLRGVGAAHFFHSKNPEPEVSRRCNDDIYTTDISYPNYHSGRNGDYQQITSIEPLHPLLINPNSPTGKIEFLPAHPHEGAVGTPENDKNARVIATGKSLVSARDFNLIVAFDRVVDEDGKYLGRAVAESTFHHFCDYNWDTNRGCPSFVSELPGNTMQTEPRAIADLNTYIDNLVLWLANRESSAVPTF